MLASCRAVSFTLLLIVICVFIASTTINTITYDNRKVDGYYNASSKRNEGSSGDYIGERKKEQKMNAATEWSNADIALLPSLRKEKEDVSDVLQNSTIKSFEKEKFEFVHIISPYKVDDCDERFCPFGQDQSVAIASMQRAKAEASSRIALAASIFEQDKDAIPPDFITLPFLKRSAATQFPNLQPKKEFPFSQDIFNSLLASNIDFEYVIYTNTDIIVNDQFYNTVHDQIAKGYDAFTINRRTVSKVDSKTEILYTASDLDVIYSLPYKKHPGHDCFIMKKDILEKLDMANVFLGTLGLAKMILIQMIHYAVNYYHFVSHDLNATYHLGDDQEWKNDGLSAHMERNEHNAACHKPLLTICFSDKKMNYIQWKKCRILYEKIGHDYTNGYTRRFRKPMTKKCKEILNKYNDNNNTYAVR